MSYLLAAALWLGVALSPKPALGNAGSLLSPTVTITPGSSTFTGTGQTYTVSVTVKFCSTTSADLDDATRSFTLDGADITSSFSRVSGNPTGCIFARFYSGNVVLPQTNDGVHDFWAEIDDVNGFHGSKSATYTYRWPGWTPPKYAVQVTPSVHTKDVAPGAGQSVTFTVTNVGSRQVTYTLTSHCARAATCTSISPSSVSLDTTSAGRSAVATLFFTAGAVGDTGTVTLVARNSGSGLSADADSMSTDIMIPASAPNNAPGVVIAGAGDVMSRVSCLTISAGDGAAYECGDLRLSHALPTVVTRGKTRIPVLLYNSAHAMGNAIVAADVTPVTNLGSLDSVTATVLVSGVQWGRGKWPGTQWTAGATRRIGIKIDSLEPTGVYGFILNVQYFWAGGGTSQDTPTGQLVVVNRSGSPLGAGWWLAGVEQLVTSGADRFWIGGDGSTKLYRASGTNLWRATTGARPDSLYWNGTSYIRTLPTGVRIEFNTYGQHVATRPLAGPATYFTYAGTPLTSPLTQITIPTGRPDGDATVNYALTYLTDSVRITLNTGTDTRTTTVYETGGKVTSIKDPDGYAVQFAYVSGLSYINGRTDRNAHTTSYSYDAAWHLVGRSQSVTGGTISVGFVPTESRGVPGTPTAAAQSLDSTYTLLDGPRTDVSDKTGFWLNKYGGPARIKNAYGRETKLFFDATWPALPNEVRSTGGTITRAWYNDRGLPDSTKVYNLRYAGDVAPSSQFTWDARFALPTQVIGADGTVTSYGYNSDGTVQFVQRGTNAAARVIPAYYTAGSLAGLYRSSNVPGRSERDSVIYDATLANPDSSMDTWRHWTRYGRDAFGRIVFTEFQTSSGAWRRDSTQYDLVGQVIRQVAFGDPASYTPSSDSRGVQTVPADTLVVTTSYDHEGNPLQVQRTVKPVRTGVSTLTTGYAYDEAGRKTNEYPDYGAGTALTYDPAGDVIQSQGEHGNLTMRYDELGHLVQRIAAKQTSMPTSCTQFIPDAAITGCTFTFPLVTSGASYTVPGDTDTYAYDQAGNLTRADNKSARIRRAYSLGGLVLGDTLRIRTLRYATEGASVVASDFNSHVYGLRYGYDVGGRRDTLWHPDNLDWCSGPCAPQRYEYDGPTGRLASLIDARGNTIAFKYTLAGQLDTVSYPGGIAEVTTYDSLGMPWTRIISGPNVGTIVRDSLTNDWSGRLVRGTGLVVRNGQTQTIYNAYAGLGALVEQEWIPSASTPKLEEFRYDALGNQLYTRRRHVILGPSADDPQWRANTFDNYGRQLRTVVPDSTLLPGTVQGLGDATESGEIRDIWYDVNGRTAFTGGESWSNWGSTRHYHQEAHYYDGEGRLAMFEAHLGGDGQAAGWNDDPNAVTESYRYDALGRRILVHALRNVGSICSVKGCESTVQRFVWDGNDLLYETRGPASNSTSSSGVENDLVGGSSEYGTLNAYGRVSYVHAFGIDRPVGLVRVNGSTLMAALFPLVNWRGLYETATTEGGVLYADRNFVKWPGATASAFLGASVLPDSEYYWFGTLVAQQGDASGLLYRRNRYYDPQTGRFTQPDPIGLAGGMNAYGFANGDPVTYSDPFGLCPPEDDKPCLGQIVQERIRAGVDAAISWLGDLGNSIMEGLKGFAKEAPLHIAAAAATGGFSAEEEAGVALFRAVGAAEAKDIAESGLLRTVGHSVEGKYFAESAADAAKWGEQLYGAGKFEIVEARFSAEVAKQMYRWERLDGIGPARFAPSTLLKNAIVNFVK